MDGREARNRAYVQQTGSKLVSVDGGMVEDVGPYDAGEQMKAAAEQLEMIRLGIGVGVDTIQCHEADIRVVALIKNALSVEELNRVEFVYHDTPHGVSNG